MLNEYYNQITPTVKVSDLCQLVASGRLEELRDTLSQLPTDALDYLTVILDEYWSRGFPGTGDDAAENAFLAEYYEYGEVNRVAKTILSARVWILSARVWVDK